MIATDLDGTLLRADGSVSDRTLASIESARRAGIEVVPATGRPRLITGDVMERLPFLDYWVLANGSVTWHLGRRELIRGFWIEEALARNLVVRLRQRLPNAGFAVEFEDDVAFEAGFEDVVPIAPSVDPSVDLLDRIDRRVQKILVFDTSKTIDDLFAAVSGAVGEDGVPSYSGLRFIELAAGEVTKATGLELLAADFGIDGQEVAAFGDNHNDVAMLRWAGRSYAMDHATADVREVADETIGSNEDDAVADKIDEFVAETVARGSAVPPPEGGGDRVDPSDAADESEVRR
jgi:Cof subfamily protein (haloacid dehalogenase superfamily)